MSSVRFNDPNYVKFGLVCNEFEVPEFVKEAAAASEQDFSRLAPEAFADQHNKLYPVNTKSNAWLSAAIFSYDREALSVEKRASIDVELTKAAKIWGFELPVRRQLSKEAACACVGHKIEIFNGQGKLLGTTVLEKAEHVRDTLDHLRKNASDYTYSQRRTIAMGLLQANESLGADLKKEDVDWLDATAGFGTCDWATAHKAIMKRAAWVSQTEPELEKALKKFASLFEESNYDVQPTPPQHMLQKAAELCDEFDRAYDISRKYGKDEVTPESELFHLTVRKVGEVAKEFVQLQNGKMLDRTSLLSKKASVDSFFEKHIGDKPYGTDDARMIDEITSLPRPDADAFVSFMGMGV